MTQHTIQDLLKFNSPTPEVNKKYEIAHAAIVELAYLITDLTEDSEAAISNLYLTREAIHLALKASALKARANHVSVYPTPTIATP